MSTYVKCPQDHGFLRVTAFLLLACMAAMAVVGSGCGGYDTPTAEEPAEPPEPPPPPPPEPIELAEFSPVRLDPGGSDTVQLEVERNGNEGPIQVELDPAPAGVSINPTPLRSWATKSSWPRSA